MKTKILKLSTIFFFFSLISVSCQNDDELPALKDKQLTVLDQKATGCNTNTKSNDVEQYIELKAEAENKLRIKFVNAEINCAGLDTSAVFIVNDSLKVVFMDHNMANCICYYDLECLVDSMEQRKYKAQVSVGGEVVKFDFSYSQSLSSKIEI